MIELRDGWSRAPRVYIADLMGYSRVTFQTEGRWLCQLYRFQLGNFSSGGLYLKLELEPALYWDSLV